MPDASPSRPRYLARLNANGVRYAYTRSKGRMISLGRWGRPHPFRNSTASSPNGV